MADVEPSEGTISETSSKFWVIRQPCYVSWGRAGTDDTDSDPDPVPLPQMSPPQEHLPADWEMHWSKQNRLPFYWNRSTGASEWEWPSDKPERLLWTNYMRVKADIQYTCLRNVKDPTSEFFEHTMALLDGWVVGLVCPQTQLAADDTCTSDGHEVSAELALQAQAKGEYITIMTLDML